ncbi:MAG TPA: asparagine--tRNA ligase [Spirochaetota bacterium]|nr:asparagine--tRNA ligase [Spirochaetota bacterium]HOD16858.1 asparagine--tRNA ligase [Spirochaetota bacterium]HPG50403.1 asparagine--tRNA ligase [Spirochaetota bacterium]HPN13047.1 asparagine--tRNA ligase [Spirochaetota bacterium]
MRRPLIKDLLSLKAGNDAVTVEGWIRTKRDSKGVTFLELNDGSSIKNLQVVIEDTLPGFDSLSKSLTTGTSIVAAGVLIESPGQGQAVELKAASITVLGGAPPEEYALQKKRHSFEFLREIAHLRPRTNSFGAVARVRSAMSFAIHRFFQENGFVYVHTPIITGSDCEGAGQMFQVTTLPLESIPKNDSSIDYAQDFFGKKAALTVSGQLEGEAYACALKNIYTFGPTFRAENSNTTRHLAEFWMIEPEMAFCDINGNMDVAEAFLKYIFQYVLDTCPDDMDFFDSRISKGIIDNLRHIIASRFMRISYTEAVERLIESGEKFEFPVKWGIDLQSEHEKFLTEKIYNQPVILTDYPKEIKAFYMKLNDDGKTVRAMDILVPRLGEIVGGSEREADLAKLTARISECGLNPDDYWWYLDLRRFGSVPHAGFGLGFERVIQFVTGMQNIRDVIPFPRAVKTLEF